MTTEAVAPKRAATEKQRTGAGRSGASNPNKITITLGGELAEQIRKEAATTGMIPASLAKQWIRLGNLLTDNSPDADRFRMGVAEKAFRDAGIEKVPAPVPPALATAKLRTHDANWIRTHARGLGAEPWIVAGVLADIGNEALVREEAAEKVDSDCNHLLWGVIHRNAEKYSESMPVFVTAAEYEVMIDTAGRLGREPADFLGTVIEIGIRIYAARKGLEFMTDFRQFQLLARTAELELLRNRVGEGGDS